MNPNNSTETIIACSSGDVRAAISVIRLSGTDFLKSINHLFTKDLTEIKPRFAYYCDLISGDEVLDDIVFTFFKGPNSYNGEDILELSVHGNPLNVKRIIGEFLKVNSIRLAKPGEFSLRAMQNKKLTLNQVEGLDLLLNANSIFSLKQGYSLLSGDLKKDFENLYNDYLNHKSSLELGFDFLEDMGEEQFLKNKNDSFLKFKNTLEKLYSRCKNNQFNLLKPEIAIVGLPNAGKSTFFNNFLNDDRAIVSEIEGTTRDYIREDIVINEAIYSLIDTAGIRKSDDIIEQKGIEKALDIVKGSFFKILLVDPNHFTKEYYENFAEINFDLVIFTHKDNSNFKSALNTIYKDLFSVLGPIEPLDFGPIEPTDIFGPIEPLISGPIEPHLSSCFYLDQTVNSKDFSAFIETKVHGKYTKLLEFDPVLITRHADSIKNIYNKFQDYSQSFENIEDLSIISSEFNIMGHCVSELIGIVSPDEVLNNIFDNFCIGK